MGDSEESWAFGTLGKCDVVFAEIVVLIQTEHGTILDGVVR